jgi:ABC-type uncharacterized transport system involved in gliding motility auxiliary subunit
MKKQEDDRLSTLDKINLAFGVLAIVMLSASLAMSYVPAASQRWPAELPNWIRMGGMGAMVLYVVTLALLKEKDIGSFLKHRHTHSGLNIFLQIAALLGILAALNYFGTRHHSRIDVTENKQYSLSEQSKKVVQNLKEPVTVTLFVKKGDTYSTNLENLWREYGYASDKIKLDVIDVDRDPTLARQNKITTYGTTMLARGDRKTTITGSQEQDLTSALIKVAQDSQKTVYFLVGHGELALDKFDKEGLSQLKDALEKQNYKIDSLALFNKAAVPSDAALVVVAGPTKPLGDKELDALDQYIGKGGRVFLAAMPQADSNLEKLTTKYGIEIKDDLVLDPSLNFFGDLAAPAVQKFPYHTVTQGLQAAYFPASRSLAKAKTQPKDVSNIAPLVETSDKAWGESDLKSRPVAYTEGKDTKGPVPLMLLAEKGKGRLVVSGNALFFANQAFPQLNNGDLFLNTLNWMADEESLVSIPPKEASNKQVNLVPAQYYTIFFGTVLGFPLLLLFGAGWVWWRRR